MAAALPHQAAHAQNVTLTATASDSHIDLAWEYKGSTEGAAGWQLEWIRLSDRNGEGLWLDVDGGVSRNKSQHFVINGETYAFAIRLVGPGGSPVIASSVVNNEGWVLATPRARTPTLISGADSTVTVASAGATTLVCFNLLSASQSTWEGPVTYLETRNGQTAVPAHSVITDSTIGVEITEAPAGITKGRGVNLSPCVNLGVGAHTVTWSWKGRDGTAATAGTTSTTITVAVKDYGPKKFTLSASPSTSITEGHSGSTDVTITVTLSEPAPEDPDDLADLRSAIGFTSTAQGSHSGSNPCDPPLNPADTDYCFPNGITVNFSAGATRATFVVRILGDNRDEEDETITLSAGRAGWEGDELVLTIRDDDPRTFTLSASPSTSITEGDAGSTDVTVTVTLSEPAPEDPDDLADLRSAIGFTSTAQGSHSGSNPCDPPLNPADTDYCFPNGITVNFSAGATRATFVVRILGDNRDEEDETITLSAGRAGWEGDELVLTIRDDDGGNSGGGSSTAPAKPSGFGATAGNRQVVLRWTDPGNASITRYEVRHGKTGARGSAVWAAIAGAGTTSYTVTGLDNGSEYSFKVRAVNTAGNGAATDWVTATPTAPANPTRRPTKPTGLTATAGNARVVLRWADPNDANITGWQVRHGKVGASLGSWSGIAGSGASTTSHTVTNLENGAAYRFLIRARNSAGNGPASDEVTATPTAQSGGAGGGSGGAGGGNSGGGSGGSGSGGGAGVGGPGGGSGNNDGGNGGADGNDGDGDDGGDNDDGGDDGDSGPGGRPRAAFTLSASCVDGLCRARTGAAVSFTDTSTGTVASRTWSFGDGGAGSGSRSPRHAWSAPGFYTVSLTVSGEGNTSTVSRKVLVEAGDPAGSCTVGGDTRCLRESRFSVAVEWWTADGEARKAGRVVHEGTDDSGLFWFFSEANWELLLKVLDGCSLNGHVWVFGASATTLGYSIRVTDTATGAMKEYRNEPGKRSSAITDVAAFPGACTGAGAGASASAPPAGTARVRTTSPISLISTASTTRNGPVPEDDAVVALELPVASVPSAAASGSCTPAAGTLCLQDGRYAVSVDWTNREGDTGKGSVAPPRADDSGLFWFFSEANWELLVKVLDACTSNGHHWVFAASATDVGFELQVRDTVTGQVRRYTHTAGAPARALADVTAFPDACTQ